MIRRSLSWAWLGLAACAVVLALLVTLLRFGSPWLAHWQQQWFDRLLSDNRMTLEVGHLGLSWRDYGPVLVMNEVSLHRPDGPAVTLRRAHVDLHLWQSLRQWQPVLNELILDGLRLPLDLADRDAASGGRADLAALRDLALSGVRRFSLRDARFLLTTPEQALLELEIPALRWQNEPGLHQGQGRLGFGPEAAQQFTFKGRFEGEQDRLDGAVYLQADGVDAGALIRRIRPDDDRVGAELSFELWLEWQQGRLSAGLLTLGENRLRWGEEHQVAVDGGRVQWQPTTDGWQLASREIDIRVDDEPWPSWRFQLDRREDRLHGYVDRLTFTDLALLAQWGEYYWPDASRQLSGIAPRGQLTNLSFSALPDGRDWRVSGELQDVSTGAYRWVPRTRGLDGRFVLSAAGGQLRLRQQQAADWVYDRAFRAPWPMRRLNTELRWRRQEQGWRLWSEQLQVDTADVTLQGWFSLQWSERESPLLSASAQVDLHRAERAFVYFPEPLMGRALVDYLQGAIGGGQAENAEVLWYGRLNGFPYREQPGIFQARVPLRDAEFRFDPHWQPLTGLSLDLLFENDGLTMTGPAGRLGEVDASAIEASIVPLTAAASLRLSAGISGDGQAVTRYLQQSPLADSVGQTLAQVQVAGPLSGSLTLDVPLAGGKVGVDGRVDFDQSRVRISPLDLPLDGVTGRLLFDDSQTRFAGMRADWAGHPLTLDYQGQAEGGGYQVRLDMRGRALAEALGRQLPSLQALDGAADWRGQLRLTLDDEGGVDYRFTADSTLAGLASGLPAPLEKSAAEPLPARLQLDGNRQQAELGLTLGPEIRGQARLAFGADGARVERLWLDAGEPSHPEPRAPLDIALRTTTLRLDDWLAWLGTGWAPVAGAPVAPRRLRWPETYRVSVQASRARLWRQPLHQLRLALGPDEFGGHRIRVQAEEAEGELRWHAGQPWQADFSRLWLAPEPAAETTPSSGPERHINPAQVPALRFACADCRWHELALGRVAVRLEPEPDGVRLAELTLDGPLLQARAHGQWLQHQSGNLSRLEWQGGTPSVQRLWEGLGRSSPFSETSASLEGQLRWLDLPWRPDRQSLNGTLAVETGAGVITELNDRGAGLLSVLSMESVLRRLRLDFRDVFEEGFYFDRIGVSGEITEGVLRSDDFTLDGAAGDLRGRGQVDLAAERIDYQFEFTPHLTGNLPVLAAFAVTPVTGLYVLALSKVLGPVVDVFTRIRYRVNGPLEQPQVTELGREQGRISLPGDE
ncbi:TIGR02099 family protein [Zobellella endophytica]|uniref:TIGR02099 family protein n=1 Tax=Zobellella endophytica TaxID=2116700 RepID=A0A2P7R962_9GAMM|nr:YhdP family protein [Zobellella endophytica]PSJ46723.1 TIGR02099 family protein [Zobellella endophytica]